MSDYLKEGFIDQVKGCLNKDGGGSGQNNVIEKIKVNGVDQTVDSNKAVDIPVPTKTSELENDEGFLKEHQDLSGYAKSTDIPTVPTNVSAFTNDANYQTADDVTTKVIEGVSKIVADAPENFDTLKEMSDWITEHEDSASAMNSAILQNKTDIGVLKTSKADVTDVDEINRNLIDLQMLGWEVPSEMSVKNSVSGNTFIQKVGRQKINVVGGGGTSGGGLDWFTTNIPFSSNIISTNFSNILTNAHEGWNSTTPCITPSGGLVRYYFPKGKIYNDIIYYELETPITMQIDGNEAVTKVNDTLSAKIVAVDIDLNDVEVMAGNWVIGATYPVKNGEVVINGYIVNDDSAILTYLQTFITMWNGTYRVNVFAQNNITGSVNLSGKKARIFVLKTV